MPIVHRYIEELEKLETDQFFCNQKIEEQNNILIIGTFNPSDSSCKKAPNTATWFYGRNQNLFWKYFPMALTNESLHSSDGHYGHPQIWKEYCIKNRVIIIDLIKRININEILVNFGDKNLDCKILPDLSNTEYFDVIRGFRGIKFNKVIYSLKWTDPTIKSLKKIHDIVNENLKQTNCIQSEGQIKYCMTPWWHTAYASWNKEING